MSNKASSNNEVSIRIRKAAKGKKQASADGPDTTTKSAKESAVRVLKSAVCPSLSGNSKLTYEMGLNEAQDLCLRITANTKAGAFCTDWTELKAIRAALDRAPRHETVTSDLLVPLWRKRSANMPGFLWSVLLHEGLVRCSAKETRRYERVEPEAFDAAVKALMEGKGAAVSADAKVRKAKGKAVAVAKPKKEKKGSKPS